MGYTHYGNYFGVTCYDSHVVGVVSIFHVTKKKNHFFLSTFDFAYTHVKKLTKYGNGTYWVFLTFFFIFSFFIFYFHFFRVRVRVINTNPNKVYGEKD